MSIYQLVVKANYGGVTQLRNIHHYEFPSYVPTETELEEAVQALADAYEELFQAAHTSIVTYNAIEARRVDIGDQPSSEIIPAGWPFAGTASGSPLPPQVAQLIVWKATTAFPRSTRTYMFPYAVTAVAAGGAVTTTWMTAAATFQLALEQLAVTAQPDAQKVAVQYGGDPRVVTASNLVSAAPLTNIWATQRSRRTGVGI